jgi:hypothetical protein
MAMRPKLWTLNGLSVELGVGARRSRRACLCARPERKAVTGRTLHIKSQRLVRENERNEEVQARRLAHYNAENLH